MEIETLLLLVFVIILLEYNLRLKKSIEHRADEKFQKMKAEYLANKKIETEVNEHDVT